MKTKRTILITGASGFIGRAILKELIESTQDSFVLLSRADCFEEYSGLGRVTVVHGDITNLELLVHMLESHSITHIFHLASEAIISKYTKSPRDSYLNTVHGVTTMLEAVRIAGKQVEKLVVSTSYKVYGKAIPPYTETTAFIPTTPYETAKACQDLIAQNYCLSFGVPVVIARSVNVYGPNDRNLSRLVPKVCTDLHAHRNPQVYKSVKNAVREFIYIDDVVKAYALLMDKGVVGEAYLIGGERSTVYDMVSGLVSIAGYQGDIEIVEDVNQNIAEDDHVIDQSKIEKLGFRREVSLEEGLTRSLVSYGKPV